MYFKQRLDGLFSFTFSQRCLVLFIFKDSDYIFDEVRTRMSARTRRERNNSCGNSQLIPV